MEVWCCSFSLVKLFIKPILYQSRNFRKLVSITLLLILNTGCSQLPTTLRQLPTLLPDLSTNANFQLSVTPAGRLGVYTVTGSTNLPNQSRIIVAAVRYLRSDKQLPQSANSNPIYSILAYQDTKVNKGKWQTTLNLWKVSPNGQFQEVWQLEQSKLGLTFIPETEVTFLATVAPTDSLSELESQLEKQGIKLVNNVVRNTSEGERYIQASQVLPIALPTGQTTLPKPRPEDINGGWGPRYLLLPEPPNINNYEKPSKRRTNAPLSPAEFMQ